MDIAGGCYYLGRNLIGNIAKDVSDIKDAKKYAINRNIEDMDKKIMRWRTLQNRRDL